MSPRRGPKSRLLEPSWAALEALLGALGPVLGLSWARLGALLGHLGTILRPQEPIGSEKARTQKNIDFLQVLEGTRPPKQKQHVPRRCQGVPSWGAVAAAADAAAAMTVLATTATATALEAHKATEVDSPPTVLMPQLKPKAKTKHPNTKFGMHSSRSGTPSD